MATHESTIMDILKEKSNVMNQAYQEFQASLKALINQLIASETTTDQKSVCETNIQRLLCDYSFKMNRLEASYLERCESIINNLPTTLTTTNSVSKLIKTSSFTRTHSRIVDSHPIKFSPSQSRQYGNDFVNDSYRHSRNASTHHFEETKQTSRARYECEVCFKSMGSAQALKEHHIQMHTTETPFHCEYSGCDKAFKIKRFLHHHVRTDHDGYPYPCPDPQCDEAFKYKQEMDAHYKSNHEHESSLKRHNRANHSVPGQSENDDVDYHPIKRRRISTGMTGSIQQSGINGSQPQHQCNICFKVFSSGSALGGHKSAAHRNGKGVTNQEEYRCNRCSRCFTTRHGLNGHRGHCPMNPKNRHNTLGNDAVFACDHCEYRATRKDNWYQHLRDQHDIAPFVCDIDDCSASFRYYRELQKHQKSNHRTSQTGHLCTSDDEEEMEMLSDELENFECSICGKLLSDHKKLRDHELLHSAERPYQCHLCESGFVLKARLRNHLLYVHKVQPYQCEHCDAGFQRKRDLETHQIQCPGYLRSLRPETEKNEKVEEAPNDVNIGRIEGMEQDTANTGNLRLHSERSILNQRHEASSEVNNGGLNDAGQDTTNGLNVGLGSERSILNLRL